MLISNTLVRNGMPFIVPVIEQVLPFVDKSLVTISEKTDDNTLASLIDLHQRNKSMIEIYTEDVKLPAELTRERQGLLNKTPIGSWVLFLDADDWWPHDELFSVMSYLESDAIDGLATRPFQILNETQYDASWDNKYFTKFFKNQKGVHYERPWPRDLIYKGNELLYWKKNKRVPRIQQRFFHLENLMAWKWRKEPWARQYRLKKGKAKEIPKQYKKEVDKIYKAMTDYGW